MPDLFGVSPRGIFAPYGPRFPGDYGGARMVFPGRPSQPRCVFPMGGLGMMMGNPGRGPFMGRMATMAGLVGQVGRHVQQLSSIHHHRPAPEL